MNLNMLYCYYDVRYADKFDELFANLKRDVTTTKVELLIQEAETQLLKYISDENCFAEICPVERLSGRSEYYSY